MDEWYDYENIRRVRRLDCKSYREEAEVQNKGKKINYDALNVTKLFRTSAIKTDTSNQALLKDKQLNPFAMLRLMISYSQNVDRQKLVKLRAVNFK